MLSSRESSKAASSQSRTCIYLEYELETRELAAAFFVAVQLGRAGFRVVVFQHSSLDKIVSSESPGILVVKSVDHWRRPYLRIAKERGFLVVGRHEEAVHVARERDANVWYQNWCWELTDVYLSWTTEEDALVGSIAPEVRRECVGNARMDLLTWIRDSRGSAKTSSSKRTVLVLMSLPVEEYQEDRSEATRELEWANDIDKRSSAFHSASMSHIDGALVDRVVIRPHYHQRGMSRSFTDPRILIQTSLVKPVSLDVLEADCVIHLGSTVAFEAAYLGVPSILLANDVSERGSEYESVSYVLKSSDDAWRFLSTPQAYELPPGATEAARIRLGIPCVSDGQLFTSALIQLATSYSRDQERQRCRRVQKRPLWRASRAGILWDRAAARIRAPLARTPPKLNEGVAHFRKATVVTESKLNELLGIVQLLTGEEALSDSSTDISVWRNGAGVQVHIEGPWEVG